MYFIYQQLRNHYLTITKNLYHKQNCDVKCIIAVNIFSSCPTSCLAVYINIYDQSSTFMNNINDQHPHLLSVILPSALSHWSRSVGRCTVLLLGGIWSVVGPELWTKATIKIEISEIYMPCQNIVKLLYHSWVFLLLKKSWTF